MLVRRFHRLLILALLTVGVVAPAERVWAQNSLSLQATPTQVTVGEQFQVSLSMNFSDSTVGGGVTLAYDHASLSLNSIASEGVGDPDFQCPGSTAVACPSDPDYLSFGGVTGLTGQATVATITFTSVETGALAIALEPATPFGEAGGIELTVDFNGTTVDSAEIAVPLLSSWGYILLAGILVVITLLVDRKFRVGLPTALTLVFLTLVFNAPRVAAQGSDADLDGIDDVVDNCTNAPNPGQRDSNGDGYGNVCDPDLDDDEDVDNADVDLMKSAFFGSDVDADLDGNGTVDFIDLGLMAGYYGGAPGPKCAACPPVVGLTGYRPQSESYGAPLLRRSILDAEEESPGAGIRINGDDDDGNSTPDRDDASVAGENDLIEVEWAVNQFPAPVGFEYVIRRSNNNIKVWSSATKGTAILAANDESVLSPAAATGSIWVENSNGGSALLTFEAQTTPGGSVVSSDSIQFFPFTSLVIGIHGEFQFPTDPVFGPNEGVSVLAVALHEQAFDSHMYVENDVEADGSGAVYDEIVSAVQNRGVTSVAMHGFSHGGGSIYDLSARLDANKASIGAFDIPFTAYTDGIENDSDLDLDPEVRLPIGTDYHVNYYQNSFLFLLIWGSPVPGADVNVKISLPHFLITNSATVQSGIYDPLVLLVPR